MWSGQSCDHGRELECWLALLSPRFRSWCPRRPLPLVERLMHVKYVEAQSFHFAVGWKFEEGDEGSVILLIT
ncbi:hypothetical protein TNCV_305001 [Trichonephila clavipes]|nr:hypothetical protein TNCV_305001 [Trichonephila clavipes]